ncbi:MAG: DPP IV N-terminal domain-containing protein, partial [Verrucomicrobia bacterium]|nr:DPP IV N-terminal domain-containing protein [Verrucomicrobiota bacterium]
MLSEPTELIHRSQHRSLVFTCVFQLSLLVAVLPAEETDGKESAPAPQEEIEKEARPVLTLDDVLDGEQWHTAEGLSPDWLADGTYTTLEASELHDCGSDIVKHDPATGETSVMVRAADLIPPGASAPVGIDSFSFSEDLSKALIYTNSQRVWRSNTRGDYWLLDRSSGELRKLGGDDAAPASLMFAELSPDGRKVAYIRERNLYIQDTTTFEITAITEDGSDTVVNATFDWVYEEEFRLHKGFRWCPDSEWLAYWRIDDAGVPTYPLVNMTDGLYPEVRYYHYPKTGQTNPICQVWLASANGVTPPAQLPVPGDARDHYIPAIDWSPPIEGATSPHLIISQLNREQNTLKFFNLPEPGALLYPVLEDVDDAWIDLDYAYEWLEDGRFLWFSDRSGWKRVYAATTAGLDLTAVTPDGMDVIEMVKVIPAAEGEASPLLYFSAAPDEPTRSYLYSIRIDGSDLKRVTPEGDTYNGTNRYNISPDGSRAVHTFSSYNVPTLSQWVELPSHKVIEVIEDNAELIDKMAKLEQPPVEALRVKIEEGVELDGWCMKPTDFDPEKKYPVLFHVYGEPAGQSVVDSWSSRMWNRYLAQEGYVLMCVDNRGTPAPRGREWRKCVHRQIGILAPADQAAAVTALLAERPYLDPERVGIWGVSGGGSMSLNAIFRYPDLYKMAMAVSFVSNQRYYDTIYQERYMGRPENNPQGYIDGSPITYAHQLKGDLLLVYGTGDDN